MARRVSDRLPAAVASVLAVLLLTGASPSAPGTDPAERAPLPVAYGLEGLAGARAGAGASPAGANDFDCRPSADKPNPVVLVHGLGASMGTNWATMSPLLHNAGYCVFALTYGERALPPGVGGLTPMEESAPQLAAFVDEVLAATGADQVDLVGHSQGTVMPQVFLKRLDGAAVVDRYVNLTPLYDGTTLYAVADLADLGRATFPPLITGVEDTVGLGCGSCPQFLRDSDFLRELYGDGIKAVDGVTYTTIMTRFDGVVVPWHSGFLRADNATDVVLQDVCPADLSEHVSVAFNPNVGNLILDALDPDRDEDWSCEPFLPLLGSPGAAGALVETLRDLDTRLLARARP